MYFAGNFRCDEGGTGNKAGLCFTLLAIWQFLECSSLMCNTTLYGRVSCFVCLFTLPPLNHCFTPLHQILELTLAFINPRRACAARVTVLGLSFHLSVRLSVCLSVTTFSPATRNKTAKKRYQRVQCHTGFILKIAFLVKMLRSKVMA